MCVYVCMYLCMHVCIYVCMSVCLLCVWGTVFASLSKMSVISKRKIFDCHLSILMQSFEQSCPSHSSTTKFHCHSVTASIFQPINITCCSLQSTQPFRCFITYKISLVVHPIVCICGDRGIHKKLRPHQINTTDFSRPLSARHIFQ